MTWRREPVRHGLASRGIKTKIPIKTYINTPDPYNITKTFPVTKNPLNSGWILTDGRKVDTGPHHMNVSSVLPPTDRMKYLINTKELSGEEMDELLDEEWKQISDWQDETGTLRYEYIPSVNKLRVISGIKKPTENQAREIAKSIREVNPSSVHFIKSDYIFNGEPQHSLGEYYSTRPMPLDVHKWINTYWR